MLLKNEDSETKSCSHYCSKFLGCKKLTPSIVVGQFDRGIAVSLKISYHLCKEKKKKKHTIVVEPQSHFEGWYLSGLKFYNFGKSKDKENPLKSQKPKAKQHK